VEARQEVEPIEKQLAIKVWVIPLRQEMGEEVGCVVL
jgi:hypothetical protein